MLLFPVKPEVVLSWSQLRFKAFYINLHQFEYAGVYSSGLSILKHPKYNETTYNNSSIVVRFSSKNLIFVLQTEIYVGLQFVIFQIRLSNKIKKMKEFFQHLLSIFIIKGTCYNTKKHIGKCDFYVCEHHYSERIENVMETFQRLWCFKFRDVAFKLNAYTYIFNIGVSINS